MTYVELNDGYNSIIDTRGIRSISVDSVSNDLHYIKIRYKHKDISCSYEYKDIETLYEDRDKIKEKLGL